MDWFISFGTNICSTMASPPLGNSDHVFTFHGLSNKLKTGCLVPLHGYSHADSDGLCFHGRISFMLVDFVNGLKLELMYISFILSIRSNLTHLDGFQELVLLPCFVEITFFVYTNNKYSESKVKFRQASNCCIPEALKYWVGVQHTQSYLMGRRCLFSLGWWPF